MIRRVEPSLTTKYKKNIEDEMFLAKLNKILQPHQEQDYKELPELHPNLFIIGAPRSGTTLLSQLIASHTDMGYINNLMAAFWSAPVYGVRLSKKLISSNSSSTFESEFGRTKGISEPHEFGYFWSSMLQYYEMLERDEVNSVAINWDNLRRILINMSHAWDGTMVYKPLLLGWHIKQMQEHLHRSCWIHIKRDPMQNALSLLDARKKLLGSADEWLSLKPKEYSWLKDKPYWHQVAGQVHFLIQQHDKQFYQIPNKNLLNVNYSDLCRSPLKILEQIQTMLHQHGSKVSIIGDPPIKFNQKVHSLNSLDAKRIAESWHEITKQGN